MNKQQDIEILLKLMNMTQGNHGSYQLELNWLVKFLQEIPENSSVKPFADENLAKIMSWRAFSEYFNNPYYQFRVDVTVESKKMLHNLAGDEMEMMKQEKVALQEKLRTINEKLLRFRAY